MVWWQIDGGQERRDRGRVMRDRDLGIWSASRAGSENNFGEVNLGIWGFWPLKRILGVPTVFLRHK